MHPYAGSVMLMKYYRFNQYVQVRFIIPCSNSGAIGIKFKPTTWRISCYTLTQFKRTLSHNVHMCGGVMFRLRLRGQRELDVPAWFQMSQQCAEYFRMVCGSEQYSPFPISFTWTILQECTIKCSNHNKALLIPSVGHVSSNDWYMNTLSISMI